VLAGLSLLSNPSKTDFALLVKLTHSSKDHHNILWIAIQQNLAATVVIQMTLGHSWSRMVLQQKPASHTKVFKEAAHQHAAMVPHSTQSRLQLLLLTHHSTLSRMTSTPPDQLKPISWSTKISTTIHQVSTHQPPPKKSATTQSRSSVGVSQTELTTG